MIDDGIYYLHPALGGCFGAGCKVAFGYGKIFLLKDNNCQSILTQIDMIGDDATMYNPIILPDNDPLDTCSDISHGYLSLQLF